MKTFTITKEQIEELSKWKHGKRLMQDWFPEAFEKKLEVIKEEKPTQEEIDRVLDYLKNKNNS